MNIAVIFAGGVGSRMRSKERPKQFLEMHGKPILIHTLEIFERNENIDAIVLSCVESWIDYASELINKYQISKVKSIVPGGETGQLSIYNGLCAAKVVAEEQPCIVLIHDGVRPLINQQVINDNIKSVQQYGSAITSVKVVETMLIVNEQNEIEEVPEREKSRLARAPQSFWLTDILNNHEMALSEFKTNFIDSCTLMRHYGARLHLIDGPKENIKITTPEDFYILRAMLDAKENEQIYI